MSWNPAFDPGLPDATASIIETVIVPRARDIGGFEVRRALPAPGGRWSGRSSSSTRWGRPSSSPGQGIDVAPASAYRARDRHLSLSRRNQHRDSLGTNQVIHPGAVNWMVAGRGVTHSERTSAGRAAAPHELFGIQTWVALPEAQEDDAPSFSHHARHELPELEDGGATLRLILGRAYGETRAGQGVFRHCSTSILRLKPGASAPAAGRP